jgi:hypothetical protein
MLIVTIFTHDLPKLLWMKRHSTLHTPLKFLLSLFFCLREGLTDLLHSLAFLFFLRLFWFPLLFVETAHAFGTKLFLGTLWRLFRRTWGLSDGFGALILQ